MADHIVGLNHLFTLNPQDISTTVWAFTKAEVSHPRLFQKCGHLPRLESPILKYFTGWQIIFFHLKTCNNLMREMLPRYCGHMQVLTQLTLPYLKKVHDHLEANVDYTSLYEDTQIALLRAYQKAEH
ncbi:hypothetical protein ACHAWF_002218 [Thalassiosira exigua]